MLDAKGVQRVASDNFVVMSGFELGPWQIQVWCFGKRELYAERQGDNAVGGILGG